jgi:hypothetical protein
LPVVVAASSGQLGGCRRRLGGWETRSWVLSQTQTPPCSLRTTENSRSTTRVEHDHSIWRCEQASCHGSRPQPAVNESQRHNSRAAMREMQEALSDNISPWHRIRAWCGTKGTKQLCTLPHTKTHRYACGQVQNAAVVRPRLLALRCSLLCHSNAGGHQEPWSHAIHHHHLLDLHPRQAQAFGTGTSGSNVAGRLGPKAPMTSGGPAQRRAADPNAAARPALTVQPPHLSGTNQPTSSVPDSRSEHCAIISECPLRHPNDPATASAQNIVHHPPTDSTTRRTQGRRLHATDNPDLPMPLPPQDLANGSTQPFAPDRD